MFRPVQAIVVGGTIAAALDIAYAFVVYGPLTYGLSPVQVLQSVAAGWIGRDAARAGGISTAALGAATHVLIAIAMATAFVIAASRLKSLTAKPTLSGVGYGFILYVAMNYVVVPLSAAHSSQRFAASGAEAAERLQLAFGALRPDDPLMLLGTIFTHTFLVGVPIAWAARRFLRK